jgi:hypothetical protein
LASHGVLFNPPMQPTGHNGAGFRPGGTRHATPTLASPEKDSMRLLISREVALGLTVAFAACGGDHSFSPTVENVAGAYAAMTFTLTTSAGTTDLLALEALVSVTLAGNGTTSGQLFVPGGAEDGGDLDEALTGTWTLTGSTITFNQSTDTFIRDVEFTAARNRLTCEGAFGDETIRLVLTRTE